ncbi:MULTISPECIES: hypothetical protein [unclassified Meiothermus]|uniref:hypothetical protein n=1 Tax=unclassified Meiothermus TaxID=370471 RepID=UPI000D7CC181|nr:MULTISPECIES: hypothetical protein [unclassified Meiothermus]PZA07797.1 hypothetical protein DNA98_05680 [Meiothermus sp. Pnk-1]RYM38901.1 hypothetical protein EWH23_04005 [Meiothermus sp. PNK-Is4]
MHPRKAFLAMGVAATLAACAPHSGAASKEPTLLIAGGVVEGRWVRLGSQQFALPAAPVLAAADGETVYAAYPFQLLVYQSGLLKESLPLPGVPKFMQVRPKVVLGGDFGLFTPEGGRFALTASDAIHTSRGLYWVDGKALYAGYRKIADGSFDKIVGDEDYVVALTKREAYRWPEGVWFPLPAEPSAVALADDLYLLTPEGIYQLSRSGLILRFLAGAFTDLAADAQGVYALRDGQLLRLSFDLQLASSNSKGVR